jgi:PTH1 family peptidyl-tRNA hydrolase
MKALNDVLELTCDAMEFSLKETFEKTMAQFNK